MSRAIVIPVQGWWAETQPEDVEGPVQVLAIVTRTDVKGRNTEDWIVGVTPSGSLVWLPPDNVSLRRNAS